MDRLACISVPALAMQVALRSFPSGYAEPLLLVREDKPSSPLVGLNRPARNLGLRVGMRYSSALSIVPGVRALVAPEIQGAREEILMRLRRWSPQVEVCDFDPGCFWLNASGFSALYGTEARWGSLVREALAQLRFRAVVVVGTSRGGTYVLARSRRSMVVSSLEAENLAWQNAPLTVFPLSIREKRLLGQLGLTTLARVLSLPPGDLARRFGPGLGQSLRRLEAWNTLPLQSWEPEALPTRLLRSETAISDRSRLISWIEPPLGDLLTVLRQKGRVLTELRVGLTLESAEGRVEVIRPAEPTANAPGLFRLLRLRMDKIPLTSGVTEVKLEVKDEASPPPRGDLFAVPTRVLTRGDEALAVLKALGGNAFVVRPVLNDSHIPHESFRWEEADRLRSPRPRPPQVSFVTAVRRIGSPWSSEGKAPAGLRMGGPYRLKTGGSSPRDCDYWFLKDSRGEVVWVSWDRASGQNHWEGVVD